MDSRAQASFEYLLMVTFGILLVTAAAFLLNALSAVANAGKAKLLTDNNSGQHTFVLGKAFSWKPVGNKKKPNYV